MLVLVTSTKREYVGVRKKGLIDMWEPLFRRKYEGVRRILQVVLYSVHCASSLLHHSNLSCAICDAREDGDGSEGGIGGRASIVIIIPQQ